MPPPLLLHLSLPPSLPSARTWAPEWIGVDKLVMSVQVDVQRGEVYVQPSGGELGVRVLSLPPAATSATDGAKDVQPKQLRVIGAQWNISCMALDVSRRRLLVACTGGSLGRHVIRLLDGESGAELAKSWTLPAFWCNAMVVSAANNRFYVSDDGVNVYTLNHTLTALPKKKEEVEDSETAPQEELADSEDEDMMAMNEDDLFRRKRPCFGYMIDNDVRLSHSAGRKAAPLDAFDRISSMAIHEATHRLYIADYSLRRIACYSVAGETPQPLFSWGPEDVRSSFVFPSDRNHFEALLGMEVVVTPTQTVLVVQDTDGCPFLIFSLDGVFLLAVDAAEVISGLGLVGSCGGNIWLRDTSTSGFSSNVLKESRLDVSDCLAQQTTETFASLGSTK